MNQCVTNYYQNGDDFMAHHNDEESTRSYCVGELGRRENYGITPHGRPNETIRLLLPHGSMFVLGPKTNEMWTHSILKKKDSTMPRITLTLRECQAFMDVKTKRLFGQGTENKTLNSLRLS